MNKLHKFVITSIFGKQYKIGLNDLILLNYNTDHKVGTTIRISDQTSLIGSKEKTIIGTPMLKKVDIVLCLLKHVKNNNITFFIKRRRKNSMTLKNHSPMYSLFKVISIDIK